MTTVLDNSKFRQRLRAASKGTLEALEPYSGIKHRLLLRCLVCKYEWKAALEPIIYKNTCCPECRHSAGTCTRRLTLDEMQARLDKQLGNSNNRVLKRLYGHNLQIQCPKGHIWKININCCKSSKGCPTCYPRLLKWTKKYIEDELFKLYRNEIRLINYEYGEHFCYHTKCTFKCSQGHKIVRSGFSMLKGTGCPTCRIEQKRQAYKKKHEKEIKSTGFKLIDFYIIEGRYHNTYQCLTCGILRKTDPYTLFKHSCRTCTRDKCGTNRKISKLGNRTVSLQGYEPQALKLLLQEGIPAHEIITTVVEGKPTIKYQNKRCSKLYIPDFYIKKTNCIVEVKSTYTLGLSNNDLFNQNKKKALACLLQGFNFRLMVLSDTGKELILHKRWYRHSRRMVVNYIKRYSS